MWHTEHASHLTSMFTAAVLRVGNKHVATVCHLFVTLGKKIPVGPEVHPKMWAKNYPLGPEMNPKMGANNGLFLGPKTSPLFGALLKNQ